MTAFTVYDAELPIGRQFTVDSSLDSTTLESESSSVRFLRLLLLVFLATAEAFSFSSLDCKFSTLLSKNSLNYLTVKSV